MEENFNKNIENFLDFYNEKKDIIDKTINDYNKTIIQKDDSEEVKFALNELIRLNKNGKLLRGVLVCLGYKGSGKTDHEYLALATAVELFQTSILIHDDIIDKADLRRGEKTIPVSYKELYSKPLKNKQGFQTKKADFADAMAICIADTGFYLANQIIVSEYKNKSNLADILSYYQDIAIKTCKGEMIDIELPFKEVFFETSNLEDRIMEIYKLKTAWYSVIGPYCLGMILGEEKEENIKYMEKALLYAGIAFQIKDDLLGIYGDEKELGKSTNSDIEEYKQTILYAHALDTKYKEELLKYYGKENLTTDETKTVKQIFIDCGSKEYATKKMNEYFKLSISEVDKAMFLSEEHKSLLKGFILYLQKRSR